MHTSMFRSACGRQVHAMAISDSRGAGGFAEAPGSTRPEASDASHGDGDITKPAGRAAADGGDGVSEGAQSGQSATTAATPGRPSAAASSARSKQHRWRKLPCSRPMLGATPRCLGGDSKLERNLGAWLARTGPRQARGDMPPTGEATAAAAPTEHPPDDWRRGPGKGSARAGSSLSSVQGDAKLRAARRPAASTPGGERTEAVRRPAGVRGAGEAERHRGVCSTNLGRGDASKGIGEGGSSAEGQHQKGSCKGDGGGGGLSGVGGAEPLRTGRDGGGVRRSGDEDCCPKAGDACAVCR
mmetsp:Transcript_153694/g.492732  ORF Transcript_153694/g.492732 Transcript_153694/m.492732 type:complete len:299 (+) Transcript_153694:235-1131(+)